MKKNCMAIFVFAFVGCTSIQTFPKRWPERADINRCPNVSGFYRDRGERGDIVPGSYDPGRHLSKILDRTLPDVADTVEIVQTADGIKFTVWNDRTQQGIYVISGAGLECKNGVVSKGHTGFGGSLGYWSVILGNEQLSFSLLEDSSLAVRESSAIGGFLFMIPVVEASNKWARFQRVTSNERGE